MGRERPRGWGSFGGEKRWRNTRKFKDKDCTFPDQTCHTSSRPVTHNPSLSPSPGREPPLPMRRRLMASRMVWCWNRAKHARATHCGHQETPDWKSPFPLSLNTPHELLCLFISPSHLPNTRRSARADRARSRLSERQARRQKRGKSFRESSSTSRWCNSTRKNPFRTNSGSNLNNSSWRTLFCLV